MVTQIYKLQKIKQWFPEKIEMMYHKIDRI